MQLIFFIAMSFILAFGFVVFFGAPFLPTLKPQIGVALDLIDLKPGQTLLELGSGDGRVLIAAAERGLMVIGYELNPILVVYSKLRARRYKGQVTVKWSNFWNNKLPEADGLFVFLLPNYMDKLDKKIVQEFSKPVKLVSFAFKIPNREIKAEKSGLYLYEYP